MTHVVKRDYGLEEFKKDKIRKSIERAGKKVRKLNKIKVRGIAERVCKRVADCFKDKEEVKTSEIRQMVLRELEKEDKRLAEEFRIYSKD